MSPKGEDVENLQVLDWRKGEIKELVIDEFKNECSYFNDMGFKNVIVMELKNEEM